MNSTFMFGEDRFDAGENYFHHYQTIGGDLTEVQVNSIISNAYAYLDERYPLEKYRENFPSVCSAIRETCPFDLTGLQESVLVDTFAAHEIGVIEDAYVKAIQTLTEEFTIGAVIDIWSPKDRWEELFRQRGLDRAFSSLSFSSDHGVVKPSPKPFQMVIEELGVAADETIFIGDSVRRDLGGAVAAGIDCILVGGASHPDAYFCTASLLDLIGW